MNTVGIELEASYPRNVTRTLINSKLKQVLPYHREVTADGSPYSGEIGWEFQSNIIKIEDNQVEDNEGLLLFKDAMGVARELGGKGKLNCGVHIHVGIDINNIQHKQSILGLLSKYDDLFYAVGDRDRKRELWCQQMLKTKELVNKINPNDNYNDKYYYFTNKQSSVRFSNVYGTVEFRYFPSFPSYEILCMWIKMCLEVVEITKERLFKPICTQKDTTNRGIKIFSPSLQEEISKHLESPYKFYGS